MNQLKYQSAGSGMGTPGLSQASLHGHPGMVSTPPPHHLQLPSTPQGENPFLKLQLQLAAVSRQQQQVQHIYAKLAAARQQSQVQGGYDKNNSLVEVTKLLLSELSQEPKPETTQPLMQHKKTSHGIEDSEDDEDYQEVVEKSQEEDQLWTALDMSGLAIGQLSANLFKYSFLTKLFLNGNRLDRIPAEIRSLSRLRVLDLSGNRLTELPREMGLLCHLKYLYLFDNMIRNLPWEFGSLFELQFLGVDGNPLDASLVKILKEKSTTGLIIYLRDNAPVERGDGVMNGDRKWIEFSEDGELRDVTPQYPHAGTMGNSFTLLSYNILCQHYATTKMYRYTPSWALSWEYRRELIKKQLIQYDSDILCLQEVEQNTYDTFFQPMLKERGYEGVFTKKTRYHNGEKVDGCAIFYKKDKWSLMEQKDIIFNKVYSTDDKFSMTSDFHNRVGVRDNIAVLAKLKFLATGDVLWCCTTHLHWDPQYNDVKAVQTAVLLEEIQRLMKQHNKDIKKVPLVFAGDLNSVLDSAVYKLLSTGSVKEHSDLEGTDYGRVSKEGFSHQLNLRSAYDLIGELKATNFSPSFTDIIDYIWFQQDVLKVRGVLGEVDDKFTKYSVGFPNAMFPSDHIPILTELQFTQKTSRKA